VTHAIVRVRWIRVVVAALLAEVVLMAIAIPVTLWVGQTPLLYVIPPACFLATLVFGRWAAQKAGADFILHGTLVGVVAALLYIGLTWGQTLPMAYLVSHGLKIIGGAVGGFLAGRQPRTAAATAVD
jgi:putative membrane protein (TIGR04086 family)